MHPDPVDESAKNSEIPELHPLADEFVPNSGGSSAIEPELDLAFILAVANSGVPDGERRVARHHAHLWLRVNASRLRSLGFHRRRCKHRLELGQQLLAESRQALRGDPLTVRNPHWSTQDRLKLGLAHGGGVLLVGASVSCVFTLLRNTIVFEQMPVAAGVTSALVAAIPVAGKLGLDMIASERCRNWMRLALGWVTLALFCLWAILLARLTGGLGGGIQDPLAMTEAFTSGADRVGWPLSVHLQYLQLMVELLGSLACFSYADFLHERPRSGEPLINPVYRILFQRFANIERTVDADLKQLGEGRGRWHQLVASRDVFVGRASARFLAVREAFERRNRLRSEYAHAEAAVDSILREFGGERLPAPFPANASN